MNREDVIRWAREAGMDAMIGSIRDCKYEPKVNALKSSVPVEWLEQFAALVASAEREECAKAIEPLNPDLADWTEFAHDRHEAAMIIRARGNP